MEKLQQQVATITATKIYPTMVVTNKKFWEAPNFKWKYCWTHGSCNHEGNNCNTPADGHKENATFENRMGGLTRRFPRVPAWKSGGGTNVGLMNNINDLHNTTLSSLPTKNNITLPRQKQIVAQQVHTGIGKIAMYY